VTLPTCQIVASEMRENTHLLAWPLWGADKKLRSNPIENTAGGG
jgi:hypothetical protein